MSKVIHHIPFGDEPDPLEFADVLFPDTDAVRQCRIAAGAIDKLGAAAITGDRQATRMLLAFLSRAVRSLEALYKRDDLLPIFKAILSDTPVLPVLANPDPRAWKEIKQLCNRLGVGTDTLGIRRNPKARAKHGVAASYALAIYRALKWNQERLEFLAAIEKNDPAVRLDRSRWPEWALKCGELPPISAESAPQWWKIGLACFKEKIPHPREIEQLRRLVISEKREKAGNFSWYPADFDSKIFDAIRKAFFHLARQVAHR